MKKLLYILPLIALTACDNYLFDKQLNHNSDITDVRSFEYTLDAADYGNIAKDKSNIAIALAAAEDSSVYFALEQVSKLKAFNEIASADMFVPAFIAGKYPQLSIGSVCNVTYNLYEGRSNRLNDFDQLSGYTLTKSDYHDIWNGRGAEYLTDATVTSLASFMASRFPSAEVGKMVALTYEYRSAEPDTIYGDLPYACTIAQLLEAKETVEHELSGTVGTIKSNRSGRFYLVDGTDSIYVYGLTDDNDNNKIFYDLNIQTGDQITIHGRYEEPTDSTYQFADAVYVNHIPANPAPGRRVRRAAPTQETRIVLFVLTETGWVEYTNDQVARVVVLPANAYVAMGVTSISNTDMIVTYLNDNYRYASADDEYIVVYKSSTGTTADLFVYNGLTFVLNDGFTTETMTFELKPAAWEADISTYYSEPFLGHGQGDFVIQNVALDGLSYVWIYSATYGMKASAYASNTNHATESWLVSPAIKLKKAINPALIFDQTQKYAADFSKECTVWVSTDYAGDVTTCSWTQLPWLYNEDGTLNVPDGGSWTFQSSGEMPLTDYCDQTIYIGFKYTSSASASATWEIQNFLVHEVSTEE